MVATQATDWERRYREGATGWERPGINPAFIAWRSDGTLTPCRILVPGCGRSVEPLLLAEAGFDVTVVDSAPSAIAAQQGRLSGLHVRAHVELGDLFAWEAPAPFDAVYDQTCLGALAPDLWPAYTGRLQRWLRPSGRLFAMFMQIGRETAGLPFHHCDLASMRTLFGDTAWQWPPSLPAQVPHPSGFTEQPVVLTRR
ncbi:TPMT family class I SAM-dependent methyltransferase [Limobrevibacterium gyesilva]|uniref:TPMT family class I SAM-dependent methyltransferase n=1 Tax=Limobrevibacterium gyesilva TaxID=2991712 RepID=A0AA42CEG4_9PROT|nr:TPMT family class I SAM-dependent methyltransferase [Limobrevibacterium gyesilva]MCW3475249.1 TPMT family class I SAM-dependent methyltransferase [Limobrevibacterium gyesilva]